ncbi:MAG: pantoate--beta-alanine ligase [Gammaproteobacteria bacterium]|nr:pantoate--beta-alanine ligase [Gammaproteobacteria bacterium]
MLITAEKVESVRQQLQEWRTNQQTIAFVPTMGNLHDGHLSLVDQANKYCDRTVVSIFVNPSQFAEGEDFTRYPRTQEQDLDCLVKHGVDLVFIPDVSEMYALPNLTIVEVNDLSGQLCGEFRPGHFGGVATVVCKLFNIVQPDIAVFGEKDYQQLVLIRTMISDLKMAIKIVGVPTVRANDGLALSSRNQYLSDQQRDIASTVYKTLCSTREQLRTVETMNYRQIEDQQFQHLKQAGFRPEYFAIRNADDLKPPVQDVTQQRLVILVAVWLGQTRLIDNLLV